jgi:enterochelin esterase-like enzyme
VICETTAAPHQKDRNIAAADGSGSVAAAAARMGAEVLGTAPPELVRSISVAPNHLTGAGCYNPALDREEPLEESQSPAALALASDGPEGPAAPAAPQPPGPPESAKPPGAPAAAQPPGALAPDAPLAVRWQPGELHRVGPLEVPGLAARTVRVYLPSTFTPETPRFGLYMFDGQNVFDDQASFAGGWHLHRAVERLATGSRRMAPIVVGIDHGGEARLQELSPFPVADRPGRLDLLLDWLTGSLMPRLAAELPLVGGPVGAVAGGSSLGGLAAFYTHFRHPEAFGGALCMSPSFWIGDGEILRWAAAQPGPEVSRVYLDCGVREGRGAVMPLVAGLAAQLAERGWDHDHLMFRPDMKGAHNERSWRRRLPKALGFFYR